jgi:omega-6 fatty acid desaturase (delta-12 desaturase)
MTTPAPPDSFARSWRKLVAPYVKPDGRLATFQLLNTGLPFLALMGAILFGIDHGIWWVLLFAPVAALLLVRLFMFQHDCGHGSFFPARWANDLLGSVLGVLTLTPYKAWRGDHAIHHAGASNLDRRGVGDVTTLTLNEYLALPPRRRLAYRLYRHPLVLFGIGPTWCFLITQRIPSGNPRRRWRDWFSVLGTNAALLAGSAVVIATLGPAALLLGWLPVTLMAATVGIWLFYVQHQFEDTYWQAKPGWDFVAAAMQGSSFYDLPRPLHWLTGNIGFHHIHHLSSRIPNYRLRACHEANPAFQAVPRMSLRDSLRCIGLALWDEEQHKLVPFRSIRAIAAAHSSR